MRRHVVLVGLPGVGKSTVGTLVAELLRAPLLDIDSILVRQMGMPIAQIFGMVGEPRFRSMERDAVRTAQAREPAVIVPGGGWAAQPGEMQIARPGSLLIYLKCAAAVAAKRSEAGEVRPLVAGAADPVERVRALLAAREPYYKLADYEVATDVKKAAEVADEVVRLARAHGGWQ
jgi:shikimate kinase